jgi:heme O synthase-like polyprenyltransferase
MIIFKIALTIFWICTVIFLIGWIAYSMIYTPYIERKNNSGRSENDPVRIWNKYKRRK